jgi:alkylation response protein AidB-like acyl-CoA dehydrogenase
LSGSESGTLGRAALIGKLYWAIVHRNLGELAMDVLGAAATVRGGVDGWANGWADRRPGGEIGGRAGGPDGGAGDGAAGAHGYDPDPLQRLFLFSRADTIYGGSNQVQRNIIGERALGLPKEPR